MATHRETPNNTRLSFYEKMGIPQASITRLAPMIQTCMSAQQTPIIIGPAGSGKTELIKQITEEMKAILLHLYTAHSGAEDVKGLFFRSSGSDKTYSILCNEELYYYVQKAEEGTPVVIFLDELNRASDIDTLNALFSMISKRGVPGLKFPDNLYIVAAGNPPTGNFQVAEMADDAYVRRLVWFGIRVDVGVWLKYAQQKSTFTVNDLLVEKPNRLPIHDKVVAYIKQNSGRLFDQQMCDTGAPHPNPASWDRVSDILKVLEQTKTNSAYNVKTILSGIVGGVIALEFWDYYNDGELHISPEEILDDKWSDTLKKLKALRDEHRHDLYSDLVSSIVLLITTEMPELIDKQIKNLISFLEFLDEDQQALFGRGLGGYTPDSVDVGTWDSYFASLMLKLQKHESFQNIVDRLQELRIGNA